MKKFYRSGKISRKTLDPTLRTVVFTVAWPNSQTILKVELQLKKRQHVCGLTRRSRVRQRTGLISTVVKSGRDGASKSAAGCDLRTMFVQTVFSACGRTGCLLSRDNRAGQGEVEKRRSTDKPSDPIRPRCLHWRCTVPCCPRQSPLRVRSDPVAVCPFP